MPLIEILELARWAPSGDNTQPWRFAISGPDRITVFGHDTRENCVFDLDGHSSQVALGALLETIDLAASPHGLTTRIMRRPASSDERPVFDVLFQREEGRIAHPLVGEIERRCVQRRPLSTRRLTRIEREALERSIGDRFTLRWLEGWRARVQMAWFNFRNGQLRLRLPEAYLVHRAVIEWRASYSEDRIPDGAVGAGALTLAIMRWAMTSWKRVSFLNRYLAGSLVPGIELDFVPALACAAHCVFIAPQAPQRLEDYVAVGRALQRFWLTATRLDLRFQPEYTPLVFARYASEERAFSSDGSALLQARKLATRLRKLLGDDGAKRAVFLGRIGAGRPAMARSTRLPLARLMQLD